MKSLSNKYSTSVQIYNFSYWSGLKMLEELYISNNQFKGPLQPYFVNFSSLRKLDFLVIILLVILDLTLQVLHPLIILVLKETSLKSLFHSHHFPIIQTLSSYPMGIKSYMTHSTLETWVPKFQLQVLSLSSRVETNSLPLPIFLHYHYNLTYLDFTGCKLGGEFPKWLLENNTKMTNLVLKNCSFTGLIQLPSRPLLKLKRIDVSDNAITGQILSNNINSIFPNLKILDMSINAIHGSVLGEFGQMNLLQTLDLSKYHLLGEIPHELSNMSSLKTLDLSDNQLFGEIPEGIFGVLYQSKGYTYIGMVSSFVIEQL